MRKFVIGDIHGAHKALVQVLERSGFDKENDLLICLGDVVDGFPEVRECIDELLGIKNFALVLGNHDEWFLDWLHGKFDPWWLKQGGQVTFESYLGNRDLVPESHRKLFEDARDYYELRTLDEGEEEKVLFVHGGVEPDGPMVTSGQTFRWDRDFWYKAVRLAKEAPTTQLTSYDLVFLGHTQTGEGPPVRACNVINLDQGAGWDGVLTIMDVDTLEWWQSDNVLDLYPNFKGRAYGR